MWCRGCSLPATAMLCHGCSLDLTAAPVRRLDCGLVVRAPFVHEGIARNLVHRLKYRAEPGAAGPLAAAMAGALPPGAHCLVPVPRARLRRWRYGLDPACELAVALRRPSGLPVVKALLPGLWWRRHAGPGRRPGPPLRAIAAVPPGAVLVDDVMTTGATLAAAYQALSGHAIGAVTATSAIRHRQHP